MNTGTFDAVAQTYASASTVQRAAAHRLMDLLRCGGKDDVLDVACGPGHITRELRRRVAGRVVGVDASPAMVAAARRAYPTVEFQPVPAEDLRYDAQFDRVFCNSALQWFGRPFAAAQRMRRALRPGGRLGIACPGTERWSPFFERVVRPVTRRPGIAPTFAHWRDPWFFLPQEGDYRRFFESAGFHTESLSVDRERAWYTVDEAFGVYLNGAGVGFTDQRYYDVVLPDGYAAAFNASVREEMEQMAEDGMVPVEFNRVYYIGAVGDTKGTDVS